MKKRILCIVTTPYFIPKGSSLRVNSILRKLSKENSVDLLVYPIGEDSNYENVNVYRVLPRLRMQLGVSEISFKKILLDLAILVKGFRLMLKNRYDIVHCEDFEAAFAGSILSLFFRKSRYVYDLHNTVVDNLKITNKPKILVKIFDWLSAFVYSQFDLVIANWKLYEDVKPGKSFLLYDESDTRMVKTEIPTKNRYLAYAGNFKRYQGVQDFIKVYSKVKPSYDLVLMGNLTDEIKDLVKNLGLEKRIHFTGLLTNIKEVNYILSNAEFCLIPRIAGDQPGLKMIHHLMLGKPSLATNIPANTELLKNGYNSVLYSTSEELVKILRDIDSGNLNTRGLERGILESQKMIKKIWSQEYFNTNYFAYEE